MTNVSRETPPPPDEAAEVFSVGLDTARAYAELLSTAGIERGLIGPGERDRIWSRHLLNCAVAAEALPTGSRVADVGSGAGLPGITWALVRPDVSLVLIEPLERRVTFLQECVEQLALDGRVTVVRGRAQDYPEPAAFDVVGSRAVAPLKRLIGWCAPLTRPSGSIVALKGRSAGEEIVKASSTIGRVSDDGAELATYGRGMVAEPTTVVRMAVDRPDGLVDK